MPTPCPTLVGVRASFPTQEWLDADPNAPLDEPIPLPNVTSGILSRVLEYCTYHTVTQVTPRPSSTTPSDLIGPRSPLTIAITHHRTHWVVATQLLCHLQNRLTAHDIKRWDDAFVKVYLYSDLECLECGAFELPMPGWLSAAAVRPHCVHAHGSVDRRRVMPPRGLY